MASGEHLVYVLKCQDGTLYTGYTNDLKHRIRMHEEGKGAKYTRGRALHSKLFIHMDLKINQMLCARNIE